MGIGKVSHQIVGSARPTQATEKLILGAAWFERVRLTAAPHFGNKRFTARLEAVPFQNCPVFRIFPQPVKVAPSRLTLIAVLAVAVAFSANAVSQATHTTVRHHRVEQGDPDAAKLTEAENGISKQDYASAEPLLKQIVAAHADNYVAWYDLGFVYRALGRRDDSIAAYRKSIEAKPDVFESNLNLGLALADSGQPEAEKFLRAATTLQPRTDPSQGRKRAWMSLGSFLEASKPDEALIAFRQAALADPKDAEPHLAAGSLLEKRHSAEAEKEYQQALTIDPGSTDANTALANLYMRQRRFSEAEPILQQFVAKHPNDAGAHFQLGRMMAISGKTEAAVAELEIGLKLDPSDAKAQGDLADLYFEAGKYEQAQKMYGSLLAASPNDADLHYGYGRALLKQKKFAEAEQALLTTVKLKPDLGTAYGDLAIAADENKDYQLAIQAVDTRAKYLPDTPMSFFMRATAYDHLHDARQAAAYYHQFLDVAGGKYPDQEWQAKHRLIAIEPKK
jgi:tetratricopeptide (TPR) repeat protein